MKKTFIIIVMLLFISVTKIYSAENISSDKLEFISIGQEFVYEDTDIDTARYLTFYQHINLGYGRKWTFYIQGAAQGYEIKEGNAKDISWTRIELAAKRWVDVGNFTGTFQARWRGAIDQNNYYFEPGYFYKATSGWASFGYLDYSKTISDGFYSEGVPLRVQIKKIGLGYYYEYEKLIDNEISYLNQELRIDFPIFEAEKLYISSELRFGLGKTSTDYNGNETYGTWLSYDPFKINEARLNIWLSITPNFSLSFYGGLTGGSWKIDANKNTAKTFSQEYGMTWFYKF
ncbi:MAG: hypothetical protein ACRCSK_05170 [Fusobacteriaceae bacterium]